MDSSTDAVGGSGSSTVPREDTGDDGDQVIASINGFRIFVCVVGLLGNITVILSILLVTEMRRKITSWYVLQLAIADTAYLITLPFQIVEDQRQQWTFPEWMCRAKNTVMYVNYYSSIFLLTVMAVDRYLAICHGFSENLRKFRTKRAVYIISASVWIVSILISIPVMINTEVKGFKPHCTCQTEFDNPPPKPQSIEEKCIGEGFGDDTIPVPDYYDMTAMEFCRSVYEDEIAVQEGFCFEPLENAGDTDLPTSNNTLSLGCHYNGSTAAFKGFVIVNFVVMFLVPFLIIAVCYTLIIRYMRKTAARMDAFADRSNRGNKDRRHRKVFIMCVMLVIVFTICWLPFHSVHLAKFVGIRGSSKLCSNLQYTVSVLTYLNSAINPFIYFIVARFRSQLKRIRDISGITTVMSMMHRRSTSESNESTGGSVSKRQKSTSETDKPT